MSVEKIPPLNALRAFDTVSRLGSISAASKALNVSASSISQHITSLETYLNAPLFERKSNRLELTQEGEKYFSNIRPAFDLISQATYELTNTAEEGPLRVSVIPSLAHGWLLNQLESFEAQFPTVQLSIVSSSDLVNFDIEDVDVAIRYGAGSYDDADSQLILKDFVAPVCTPDFARSIQTPADIVSVRRAHASGTNPLVVTKWVDWAAYFIQVKNPEMLDGGKGPIFDDAMALLSSVLRGRCVGLARYSLAKKYLDEGVLVAPVGSWVPAKGGYYVLTPKRRTPKLAAKKFRRWIKKHIADDIGMPFK
ncbi:LysR substrate-binding domain-containing protein [Phaeobacter inhibens]|uniref:LysR substrate-binding domain-containing protein n=1 Tax=Phaeobacter inhibens TaxID=221822 RepID=UPI0026E2D178|nr:LysR substrate-binding domain-containing protein [Phaeobacter inhibens]MDO6758092.1 LysR substrate-binding domain-containing protein [Phaeobacter inhibens]